MAGRGIVFRAIYQEAGAPDKAFEIEVAKHSPLSIVKEQLHALLPNSALTVFKNCGHFCYQDKEVEFTELVRTWVCNGHKLG